MMMSGTELIAVSIPRALATIAADRPALFLPHEKAAERFFDFFTSNIRNKKYAAGLLQSRLPVLGLVSGQGSGRAGPGKVAVIAAQPRPIVRKCQIERIRVHHEQRLQQPLRVLMQRDQRLALLLLEQPCQRLPFPLQSMNRLRLLPVFIHREN
jgi:hypothetical protein